MQQALEQYGECSVGERGRCKELVSGIGEKASFVPFRSYELHLLRVPQHRLPYIIQAPATQVTVVLFIML